jgi:hypothetical protein
MKSEAWRRCVAGWVGWWMCAVGVVAEEAPASASAEEAAYEQPALVQGQLTYEADRVRDRIRLQEKVIQSLKDQGHDPEHIRQAEFELQQERWRLEQLQKLSKARDIPWQDGPADSQGDPLDDPYVREILKQSTRPAEARSPVAGEQGGYVVERGAVGANQPDERDRLRWQHQQQPGDHTFRPDGAAGTGPVPDPFQKAADAVSQVHTSVTGIKQIIKEVD